MSPTDKLDPDDLSDLYQLADQHLEMLHASGALPTAPDGPTIYSQCGEKPEWP